MLHYLPTGRSLQVCNPFSNYFVLRIGPIIILLIFQVPKSSLQMTCKRHTFFFEQMHCNSMNPFQNLWSGWTCLNHTSFWFKSYIYFGPFRSQHVAALLILLFISLFMILKFSLAWVLFSTIVECGIHGGILSRCEAVSACIFVAVEPEWDMWTAIWYVMVTATTVGYGDKTVSTETLDRKWKRKLKGWWKYGRMVIWLVVSNIFDVHPYLGKWSNMTHIFQMGWNHQLVMVWLIVSGFSRSF